MKKLGILLASLFVMTLATQHVKAQTGASASASAQAKATVVTVISITKIDDLNFGSFAPGANGGTVSVQLDGTRSFTGSVTLLDQGEETPTRALYNVRGKANASFYVKLPDANSVSLTGPANVDPLKITLFVHNAGDNPALDGNGEKQFSVGATLAVNPNQPAGTYTGTFDVIVAYN
jgi:spore coat protein U-like protein